MSTTTDITTPISKPIDKIFTALETSEGRGARVRRVMPTGNMVNFTPFLMFDHFKVPSSAGFPDHPHRGQETITYVVDGSVDHEDFTGSKGTLNAGDLQFMTAGRGIVHAEMPSAGPNGEVRTVEGIQLWVDLPKELKNCKPRYRDLRAAEIPIAKSDSEDLTVKVISGKSMGVDSVKDLAYTPVWFLDFESSKQYSGREVNQDIPEGFNSLLYVMKGTATVNGKKIKQHDVVIFKNGGDSIDFIPGPSSRVIVIGGKILEQPIVQHGPFVATTRKGIVKAFEDYQTRTHGFEQAKGWSSEIGKRMKL
ncbi:Pirin [Yarrowia lipolytica]|nr:Pirin [Yarrowia lipolytica]